MSEFVVRALDLDDPADDFGLIELRYAVLRAPLGLPKSASRFDADRADGTIHLGAVDESGAVIGCATLVLCGADESTMARIGGPSIQLRGMAVDPNWQGKGVGRGVLLAAHALADEQNLPLWCNARVAAAPFYAACGWERIGDEFHIEGVGPHYIMRREREREA